MNHNRKEVIMKKVIAGMAVFAVSVALLCVGLGCDGNGRSVDWDGQVDGFLGRINETPGGGSGGGTNIRQVTVVSAGSGAYGSGPYVVGTLVSINAGTRSDPHRFIKWTANKSVNFADSSYAATTFIMPASDVTVTANFWDWGTFTDGRDQKKYKTAKIGNQTWMAENLNYATSSGSWCYGEGGEVYDGNESVTLSNSEIQANWAKYGRLYDWNTAKTACPTGWHLPSNAEWDELMTAVGGYSTAGTKLKSKSGWNDNGNGTDDYGFSALPGGLRYTDGSFGNAGNIGDWWTATEFGSGVAYFWNMFYIFDDVDEYDSSKDAGYSVRCVKND
jgi:uncharacterized protein (TIGR02145 family)